MVDITQQCVQTTEFAVEGANITMVYIPERKEHKQDRFNKNF